MNSLYHIIGLKYFTRMCKKFTKKKIINRNYKGVALLPPPKKKQSLKRIFSTRNITEEKMSPFEWINKVDTCNLANLIVFFFYSCEL